MLPNWLPSILVRLPGRPVHHVYSIMLFVSFTLIITSRFFPLIDFLLMFLCISFFITRDNKVDDTEILDIRDWLVIRSIATGIFMGWFFSILDTILSHPFRWTDLFFIIFLILMPRTWRIYNAIATEAPHLPNWYTPATIMRTRAEEGD